MGKRNPAVVRAPTVDSSEYAGSPCCQAVRRCKNRRPSKNHGCISSDLPKKSAEYFEEEADSAITKLTSLLQPIMLVIVAIVIVIVILAILLPMFGMYDAIV